MAMISSNELRPGTTVKLDNAAWQVVDFQHVKPGKGAAFVRTKLKNIKSGNVNEKVFRAGEKVEKANIEKKTMQYLFSSGEDEHTFMDNETFEQINLTRDQIGGAILYIKEEFNVDMIFDDNEILGVEAPNFVELKVVETEPNFKGDTAQGGTKPAKLETGATVSVPMFVVEGNIVKVDTRTNSYLSRV